MTLTKKQQSGLMFIGIGIIILLIVFWDKVSAKSAKAIDQIKSVTSPVVSAGASADTKPEPKPIRRNRQLSTALVAEYSPEVEELQSKLNEMGANPPLVVDGLFGQKTSNALVGMTLLHAGRGTAQTTLYDFDVKIYNDWKYNATQSAK